MDSDILFSCSNLSCSIISLSVISLYNSLSLCSLSSLRSLCF